MITSKTPKVKSLFDFPQVIPPSSSYEVNKASFWQPPWSKCFGGASFIRHLSSRTADFPEILHRLPFRLKRLGGKENYLAFNNTRDHFLGDYLFSGDRLLQSLVYDAEYQ